MRVNYLDQKRVTKKTRLFPHEHEPHEDTGGERHAQYRHGEALAGRDQLLTAPVGSHVEIVRAEDNHGSHCL